MRVIEVDSMTFPRPDGLMLLVMAVGAESGVPTKRLPQPSLNITSNTSVTGRTPIHTVTEWRSNTRLHNDAKFRQSLPVRHRHFLNLRR